MAREVLHRVIYENDGLSDPVKAKLAAKLRIRPAILHDHTRRRVRYADYPGMIPLAGHTVRGTYVTGLRDIDIRRLDMFEGGQYERQKIRCHIITEDGKSTGEECVAETYIFTEGDEHLENREWDYEEFRRDKLYRWSGQSEEFKGWLANVLQYGCEYSKLGQQSRMNSSTKPSSAKNASSSPRRTPMRKPTRGMSLIMLEVEAS